MNSNKLSLEKALKFKNYKLLQFVLQNYEQWKIWSTGKVENVWLIFSWYNQNFEDVSPL